MQKMKTLTRGVTRKLQLQHHWMMKQPVQMNPEVMAEMMGPTFQFGRQFVETLGRSMESMMKAATDAQPSKDSKS